MTGAFARRGRWWLPDKSDPPRTGLWSFVDDSLRTELLLDGPLLEDEIEKIGWPPHDELPVVFGETTDGSQVTLCDTKTWASSAIHGDGKRRITERVTSPFAFVGAHLSEGINTTLVAVTVEFGHLTEWMQPQHPISGTNTSEDGVLHLTYDFALPPSVVVELDSARIEFKYGFRGSSNGADHAFSTPSVVNIFPKRPMAYLDLVTEMVWPLQHFLALAFDAPCRLTAAHALADEHWLMEGADFAPRDWAYVLEVIEPRRPSAVDGEMDAIDMLFGLRWVENIGELVQHWFDLWAKYQDGLILILASTMEPTQTLQLRYLLLSQGIEVFHRTFSDEKPPPDADLTEHRERILAVVENDEDRTWLSKRLRERSRLSLRDRIERMIALAGPHTQSFLRDDFAEVAAATRNYLTHYERSGRAASGQDLYLLAEEAYVLIQLILLRLVGVEEEQAWKFITMSRRGRILLEWKRRAASTT